MIEQQKLNRRAWFKSLTAPAAAIAMDSTFTCQRSNAAQASPKDNVKVTNIETFVLRNSWVFVKISTNAGITGWGEMLNDDCTYHKSQLWPDAAGAQPQQAGCSLHVSSGAWGSSTNPGCGRPPNALTLRREPEVGTAVPE